MIFLIILILLILNPSAVAYEVINTSKLWLYTLIPIMYPSFICIDMMVNSKIINKISFLLYPIFKIIFNINSQYSAFVILLSFICGTPASTKLIKNGLINNQISNNEANNLICSFSTLSLPYILFILNDKKLIILYYLFSIILSSIFMHIFNKKEKMTCSIKLNNNNNKISLFINSIKKNIETMLNILGIIMFFKIIISLLNLDNSPIYSYLEILGGINKDNKIIFISSLSFLGISIHLQMLSIFPELNYLKFLLSRLFFTLITSLWIFY